jgi:hypothetical protein
MAGFLSAQYINRSDRGLCSADMPDDQVSTMQSNEHINVEADGKVTTQ